MTFDLFKLDKTERKSRRSLSVSAPTSLQISVKDISLKEPSLNFFAMRDSNDINLCVNLFNFVPKTACLLANYLQILNLKQKTLTKNGYPVK